MTRATKAELDRAVRELERSRDTGQYAWTGADPTLKQWLEHWLDAILPATVRWKTLSTYRSQMRRHVIPALGAMRLSQVRAETLEEHYRHLLDSGCSPHVVHAVHRVLRSALNEAVTRRRLVANPAHVARPPRVPVLEVEPLTVEECRRILAAAEGQRNAARWSVALALGLRQGEALGAAWSDVDFEAGTLRIRRAVQRRTWEHGCAPHGDEPACGRKRGADCPLRLNGGVGFVETKTTASRRTIALPSPLVEGAPQASPRAVRGAARGGPRLEVRGRSAVPRPARAPRRPGEGLACLEAGASSGGCARRSAARRAAYCRDLAASPGGRHPDRHGHHGMDRDGDRPAVLPRRR